MGVTKVSVLAVHLGYLFFFFKSHPLGKLTKKVKLKQILFYFLFLVFTQLH